MRSGVNERGGHGVPPLQMSVANPNCGTDFSALSLGQLGNPVLYRARNLTFELSPNLLIGWMR